MTDFIRAGINTRRQESDIIAHCDIYLPNISADKGYQVTLQIIHQDDQFVPAVPATHVDLHYAGGEYGLWQGDIKLSEHRTEHNHMGDAGAYVYRFQLRRHAQLIVHNFSDPCAKHSANGTFSLFHVEPDDHQNDAFSWSDEAFVVPGVDDMLVYECLVSEFNGDFDGVVKRLDYLKSLGVNVIELMPITNIKESFRWGYMPLNYFAVEERYGGALAFKRMINACHEYGIAVIVDAVYAHAHPEFAYNLVYNNSGEHNPMMGLFARDDFGRGTDYSQTFTRDYFMAVNRYWLDEYHVDGFRYDYVPGFYDGPTGQGYAALVYNTYRYSVESEYTRFMGGEFSRIIQCAEHLPAPQEILSKTYSNCCWQNDLMDKVFDMTRHHYVDDAYVHNLCLIFKNYPDHYRNEQNGEQFPVNVFQYIESHDHSRLITSVALSADHDVLGHAHGDRRYWYKLQPYIIGLYTCAGIPMLWNGQEFGENYSVPHHGPGRVFLPRPLHWEYFYDEAGQALIALYRKMAHLRQEFPSLRSRHSYYYYQHSSPLNGVVVYARGGNDATTTAGTCIVLLNFSDRDFEVAFTFPSTGLWRELLHHNDTYDALAGEVISIQVPSNYAKIFTL